jgi:carbon storage regulator
MLIITRRAGQRVMLGDDIAIHVMEIAGNNVRLGIAAPQELPVYREEIWAAVKHENEAAATVESERIASRATSSSTV